ncbi:TIGR02444 family protein [Alcanivorax quisquiliarum]|uniref:TIGR02444 family protein n=1 Tax=Alcanivorax quisquiliarum TaxID=2933565 RepID=A0ABT0EAD0_9GAMM|nr:TIGR02444 family protein [Alcanivorax quisquiliarum]MCK0538807.1 TIGR02444 family protein [Alcanivorax quisquiliarum]
MVETTKNGEALWRFALALWKRPGVERAALLLQDQHGISVCLLLAALWLAREGVAPEAGLAGALRDEAEKWERERIGPLRQLRRLASSRPQWGDWQRSLQDAELEAERLLLAELAAAAGARPLPRAAQPENAHAWLLTVLPEMASCENLAAATQALLAEAAQP